MVWDKLTQRADGFSSTLLAHLKIQMFNKEENLQGSIFCETGHNNIHIAFLAKTFSFRWEDRADVPQYG